MWIVGCPSSNPPTVLPFHLTTAKEERIFSSLGIGVFCVIVDMGVAGGEKDSGMFMDARWGLRWTS